MCVHWHIIDCAAIYGNEQDVRIGVICATHCGQTAAHVQFEQIVQWQGWFTAQLAAV
jgi:hypothetical protein